MRSISIINRVLTNNEDPHKSELFKEPSHLIQHFCDTMFVLR